MIFIVFWMNFIVFLMIFFVCFKPTLLWYTNFRCSFTCIWKPQKCSFWKYGDGCNLIIKFKVWKWCRPKYYCRSQPPPMQHNSVFTTDGSHLSPHCTCSLYFPCFSFTRIWSILSYMFSTSPGTIYWSRGHLLTTCTQLPWVKCKLSGWDYKNNQDLKSRI